MRGIQPSVSIIILALAGSLGVTAPAWAHAKLLLADPRPGSTIKAAPKVVRAWFSEELDAKGSALSVWDSRGKRKDDGRGGLDLDDLDHKSLVVKLPALGPGTYTVRWTAVSADDKNVTKGSFRFALVSDVLQKRGDEAARADQGISNTTRTSNAVAVKLKPDLRPGAYVVMWRVLSIDTHTTQGFYVFVFTATP